MTNRQQAIQASANWWQCDNLVNHFGIVGLLRTETPKLFITIEDEDAYLSDFDTFCEKANITLLDELAPVGDLNEYLTEAWNFLALQEEEEERLAEEREMEDKPTDY